MIVLDTNVLSELMKSETSQVAMSWFLKQSATSLFITTVTQAEILYGPALFPTGKRREALRTAAQTMFEEDFSGRILPFDIAAITRSRGAALSTRNVRDFEECGLQLFNPWDS